MTITIDTDTFPPAVLSLRGRAEIDEVDGVAPRVHERHLGQEQGAAMAAHMDVPGTRQARVLVRPAWVGVIDFLTRAPGGG